MDTDDFDPAFARWLQGMGALTSSAEAAKQWRERRYTFAHRLGEELAGQTATHPPVADPAVYGIWLNWALLYVGQTTEGARRLRDLPIGESHHLANTFPPEIWDRVIVINWPALPEAQAATNQLDEATIGLALEHHLQVRLQPLANSSRRTKTGGWRTVNWGNSKSRGARAEAAIVDLSRAVDRLWNDAAANSANVHTPLPASVRCVRPVEWIDFSV